jgi:hypothetical protein
LAMNRELKPSLLYYIQTTSKFNVQMASRQLSLTIPG